MQELERITGTGFVATAAWTAVPSIHIAHCCLPSVRLPRRALVTNPVSTFVTATCDLAGIKACCSICVPVPKLHHGMLTLCQSWAALLLFVHLRMVLAGGATAITPGAVINCCHPLMTMTAFPMHPLAAASHYLMWSAMIAVTPLCCNFRSLGSERIVGTDSSACTEGAASSI